MDIGNAMHQQFIKDFIHSLQADSEDNNSRIQSRSMSESSLNPNAAEFVPSYLKSSDGDDEDEEPPNKHLEPKVLAISTTTLVNDINMGDASCVTRDVKQNRIQRQLFNLMNLLGNQNLPLSEIIFSLASNGQGINVQFMAPENGKRQPLDKHLCHAAGLHLKVGDGERMSTRSGNALAAQFLNRMGNVLSDKTKDQLPSLCPKCTGFQKKNSYTDLEIDRQIEDIKAFERLINEDAGVRYQEAFKELCNKLGLTANSEHSAGLEGTAAAPKTALDIITDDDETDVPFVEDERSNYDWDSFSPGFTPMKVDSYSIPNGNEMCVDEKPEHQHHQLHKEQLKLNPDVPSSTPAMSPITVNGSSVYPKLYKMKWSNLTGLRKANNNHKERESKILRWRGGSPAARASAAARTTGGTSATAAASGGTATASGTNNRPATKKTPDQIHPNGSRTVRASQRALQNKSGIVSQNITEVASQTQMKSSANYKLETRQKLVMSKQHINQVPVSKITKPTTLSRPSGLGHPPSTKNSPSALRVVAPRSTHASQMRQSEVKRRLRLLRGDEDTDVQVNEYLFK